MQRPNRGRIDVEAHMVHGKELVWDDTEYDITDPKIMRALNWYNYNHSKADAKKFIVKYYKSLNNKDMVKVAKKFDESKLLNSVGWFCDMITNGANLVDEDGVIFSKIEDLENNPEKYMPDKPVKTEVKKDKRTISPKDRMKAFHNEYVITIDVGIEAFVENGCREPNDFSLYDYLDKLKNAYYNGIIEEFKPLRDELEQALEGKDKDLKESYAFLTKPELKRYLKYVESITSNIERIKKKRKAEKAKEKKRTGKNKKVVKGKAKKDKTGTRAGKIVKKKTPTAEDGLEQFL